MTLNRSAIWRVVSMVLTFVLACGRCVNADQAAGPTLDPALGIETLRLWDGTAPGAKGAEPQDVPTLTVLRPSQSTGAAMIVAPGGGYVALATAKEGREPADYLASLGVTVFVLKYRLGPRYLYPVELADAQRAVRLVRSLAGRYGYSPDRIGMLGFSAGGHLTAMVGVSASAGQPAATDPVERQGSALNFMVLGYPWLNAMEPRVKRGTGLMINYCSVTKGVTEQVCERLEATYTPKRHVSGTTPPAFLFATTNDDVVPSAASTSFYSAMEAAGRDCEMHLFAHGPHGFGMGSTDPVLRTWPRLMEEWMRGHGWLAPLASTAH